MRYEKLTDADLDAARQICFAVKYKLVVKEQELRKSAEEADGEKKEQLLKLAAYTNKRAIWYFFEGLRAGTGNVEACERSFSNYAKLLNFRELTDADFRAAAYVCHAVKYRLIVRMRRLEKRADEATGQNKEHLLKLGARINKRAYSYLREGLRADERNVDAYTRTMSHHVKLLLIGRNIKPRPTEIPKPV